MNPLLQRFLGAVRAVPKAFEIGKRGRRLASIPTVTVALNTLIQKYGRTAVARSRYLSINNPYTVAAKETFVSAMVGGAGIRPSTLGETKEVKTRVHDDWSHWAETADAEGVQNLAGLEGTAASELFEAGEVFVQFIRPSTVVDGDVPLKLKLIPSEMLPLDNYSAIAVGAGNYIQLGIEFNPQGERVAYHFLTVNPTDQTMPLNTYERVRVPAADVMHVYRPLRAGQIRGIPQTLGALVASAMLDLYDDAELERKRVASLFAAFVTKTGESADSPLGKSAPVNSADSDSPSAFTLQPGLVIDLLPGEDVTFSSPADTGPGYDAFQYRQLCRMAAGFGVPYASMSGDLKAANYGSIRAGLVQFRRRIESMQFQNFIPMLMRPTWLRWLREYTFAGLAPWSAADWLANMRQHQKVKWLCPRWDWVDPLKDMQAEKLAVDNGFQSRFDVIEESGADPDETDERIIEAQESEDEFPRPLNTGQQPPTDPSQMDTGDGTPPNPQENPSAQ